MRRGQLLVLAAVPACLHAQVKQYRLAPDPTFVSTDLTLGQRVSLEVDRQHAVYVKDGSLPAVYRLSPDGRSSTTVIREGAGPGEMRNVSSSGWQGDTLWLWDSHALRFTFLAPGGRFLRAESYDRHCRRHYTWGLLSTGGCL
jgi:hypothetical protein